MTNNNQQPPQETPNNQFSNNEPMTFAQKVEYVKSIEMTNNKQQTAVEWLAEQMEILHYDYWAEHISKDEKNQRLKQLKEQAKEMEKEQHATTWDKSMDNLDARGGNIVRAWVDFDEYYNQTFGADHIVDTNKMI
jgi:hypothetical protein